MTCSDAERWYRVIKASSLEILRKEFFKYCAEYAQVRTQWSFLTKEERLELDQSRTLKHNALISSANALSRNMVQNEEDASWRAELGPIADVSAISHVTARVSLGWRTRRFMRV